LLVPFTRKVTRELEAKGIMTLLGNGGFQIDIEVLPALPRIGGDDE
jgi:hypothetical protein